MKVLAFCIIFLVPCICKAEVELTVMLQQQIDHPNCYAPDSEIKGYFIGVPIKISVATHDYTALRELNKINSEYLDEPKKKSEMRKTIKFVHVASTNQAWISYLKPYLCPIDTNQCSLNPQKNLLRSIKLADYDWPVPYLENNYNLSKKTYSASTFYLPGEATQNAKPGKYQLYFEFDNSQASEKDIERIFLTSKPIIIEFKEANDLFEKAQLLFHQGKWIEIFKQDKNRALEYFLEAIRLEPDFPTPYLHIGGILYSMGKKGEAYFYFQKNVEVAHTSKIKFWSGNKERQDCDSHEATEMLKYWAGPKDEIYPCPTPLPTPWPSPTPLP